MTEIVVTTRDELRALVAEAVRDALAPRADESLVALADTGVPVRSLRRAIRAGELTASRVGRQLLVRRGDLARWLDSRRVQARPVVERRKSPASRAIAKARLSGGLRVVGA